MKTRLLTAAVGIPLSIAVLVASVYFPVVFFFVILALGMIGIYEALGAIGVKKNIAVIVPCFVYGAFVISSPFISGSFRLELIAAVSLVYLFYMFAVLLRNHAVLRLDALCTAMIMTGFVAFPFMSLELIFGNVMKDASGQASYANGIALISYCLIVAWVADGGAYFVGSAVGKHKMAPVISPKKTIEGAVGGFIISMIISLAAAYIYSDVLGYIEGRLNLVNAAVITAVCILMSMFGDLSFSAVKRQYGVKDFGNLLPGHGGVLDRFDSVLFVGPTFYLLSCILPLVK